MTKKELRIKYRKLRKTYSAEEVETKSLQIANHLLNMSIWHKSYYHIFLSISEKTEVQTNPILSILNGTDKHIVIPKSHFDSQTLSHYLLTDNTLIKPNDWNIPEPVEGIEIDPLKLDVVFIPLLAYDLLGNRVGYGKGFYDRFLSECRPETIKIGLSFFEPENTVENMSKKDVRLNFCVTPDGILEF